MFKNVNTRVLPIRNTIKFTKIQSKNVKEVLKKKEQHFRMANRRANMLKNEQLKIMTKIKKLDNEIEEHNLENEE